MTDADQPTAPIPGSAPQTKASGAPSPASAGTESVVAAETPAPAPAAAPREPRAAGDRSWWLGTGRRKSSVARVRVRPGKGEFVVNKRPYTEFFTGDRDRKDLETVLEKTSTAGAVDVHVAVHGGGVTGQAGAIVLGLARALRAYDSALEPILRDNNFLTRDPREVERKKYGQPGARARFQFSKR